MDNVKKPVPATNSGNGQSVIDRADCKSKDNFPNGQQPSPYFDEYENGLIDIYAPGRVRRFLFVSPFLQQIDMLEFPVHRRDDDSPCQPVRRVQLAPPPLTPNVRTDRNSRLCRVHASHCAYVGRGSRSLPLGYDRRGYHRGGGRGVAPRLLAEPVCARPADGCAGGSIHLGGRPQNSR